MTPYGQFIIAFVILDLLELVSWLFSVSPFYSWNSGPIDAQSGLFFICLIGLYITISFSIVLFLWYAIKFYNSLSMLLIGLALNLPAIIAAGFYLKQFV
ncbi:MAG: hypothetical protein JW982_08960 [Spirochaetes bacterium]|nr:hypothetical protein [Spirochaetota bacterium]